MSKLAVALASLLLAGCLLAGCKGHPNPDPVGAAMDRRAAELRAVVGRRVSTVRVAQGGPEVVYDVYDLLCTDLDHLPEPEISLPASPGSVGDPGAVLTFDDEPVCSRIDADKLVELVEGKLGVEGEEGIRAECHDGWLLVSGPWWTQEKVCRLLRALADAPNSPPGSGSNLFGR